MPNRDDLLDDLNLRQIPLMPYEGCSGSSASEALEPGEAERAAEFDAFHTQHVEFIRARDFRGAEALCRSYLARADAANDLEGAAGYAGSLATMLAFQQRDVEALEALQAAERYQPGDPHRKIAVARFLMDDLGRPEEGLAKLAEAEPLLDAEGGLWEPGFWRSSWLNQKGLGQLAAGRFADAVACLQGLARPERLEVMRRATSLRCVDLRLVGRLVALGMARDESVAYLEVAEAIGVTAEGSDPTETSYLKTVRKLLERARGA